MIEHYSSNIQNAIQKELFKAKSSIKIAVAWFTNDLLFQPLLLKLQSGVRVELILNKDDINQSSQNEVDFGAFIQAGGLLHWNETKHLMHDKLCIIDDSILIYGSYNWTNRAEYNDESITILREEPESVVFYQMMFEELAQKYPLSENVIKKQKEEAKNNELKEIERLRKEKEAILAIARDELEKKIRQERAAEEARKQEIERTRIDLELEKSEIAIVEPEIPNLYLRSGEYGRVLGRSIPEEYREIFTIKQSFKIGRIYDNCEAIRVLPRINYRLISKDISSSVLRFYGTTKIFDSNNNFEEVNGEIAFKFKSENNHRVALTLEDILHKELFANVRLLEFLQETKVDSVNRTYDFLESWVDLCDGRTDSFDNVCSSTY